MIGRVTIVLACIAAAPCASQTATGQRVKYTVHNLSASGPGTVRAESETEICVFCHTPHSASVVTPLWNRDAPQGPYEIYRSVSMRAEPGQPTGSSKLCLSCHDGTIALGNVLSRDVPITMAGGLQTLPPGGANLGTDLGDDHPVSFSYAASFAGSAELASPDAIVPPVTLDDSGQVQCTSCHEPHDDSRGDFLVMELRHGELCRACHRLVGWAPSVHAVSGAVLSEDVAAALGSEPQSVSNSACTGCHRMHHATGRSWLLQGRNIAATCATCHDGGVARDIESEIGKGRNHGMSLQGVTSEHGTPYLEGHQVSCGDCHASHCAGSMDGVAPGLPASLAGVAGVNLGGATVAAAAHEYELCFRCHGDRPVRVERRVTRSIVQDNKRLQFQTDNPSFHPVAAAGRNPSVPSLAPHLLASSTIGCGDCHASEGSRRLGGTAPAGPHGSAHESLLAARYETGDFTPESPTAYALCYRCHVRDSILGDQSFTEHRKHIEEHQAPCSACHDPHGIYSGQGGASSNSHLINFDRAIVFPNPAGRIEFIDGGVHRGTCSLSCHGVNHGSRSY